MISRFYGNVDINAQRVNRDVSTVVEEVIQHLTALTGCEVQITLEISAARPEGFDDATIRTVNENSKVLKFTNFGFEES